MTIITDLMNFITQITLYGILFMIWAYGWISIMKWFWLKAKVALHYLFPNVKWFTLDKENWND